jgi:hypothetical protein
LDTNRSIEFSIIKKYEAQLLQVRRITTSASWDTGISINVDRNLQQLHSFVSARLLPCQNVVSQGNILTTMSDWNPLEMIGTAPRRLD